MNGTPASPMRQRSALDWLALIALPILLNVALGLFLFGPGKDAGLPGFSDPQQTDLPLPSGDVGQGLPRAGFQQILAQVRAQTGRVYACDGPWRASDRTIAWSCREQDSLAVLRGVSAAAVFAIEITWFGFDPSATDLPAWAAAVFSRADDGRQASSWVTEHIGVAGAKVTIAGVSLRTAGARGALTLDLSR
jgi:hypothetical protein